VPLTGAIPVDDQQLRGHIEEVVRSSVEEMLNALLDAEADQDLRCTTVRAGGGSPGCAGRALRALERRPVRSSCGSRSGGAVPFETAIIERYHTVGFPRLL